MRSSRLVIFDWDGTLMDSVGRIVSSMRVTATALNLVVPTYQSVKDIIGLSLEPAIERLFGRLPRAQYDRFLSRYRDEYVEFNTTPTPMFDNAEAVIQLLKQQQHAVAVATGKARRGLDRVWAEVNIGPLFNASRCADETQGKPNPQMLHELMEELGYLPNQTIMVGDSVHDIRMATNAGVKAIGVDFGVHDRGRLLDAGADHVVSNLDQLPLLITALTEEQVYE